MQKLTGDFCEWLSSDRWP